MTLEETDSRPQMLAGRRSHRRVAPSPKPSRRRIEAVNWSRALQRAWAWLLCTYATVDPRSLGVCRILTGLLLFADVARRYRDLDAYYTNLGWLTNHFSLYRPMSSHVFSIYHAFSTPAEVRVLFFAHCLVNLLFLVGYRTRLTHFLAMVLLGSINSRNIIIENGGFVMLMMLVLWTWFLPMGARFSVDAWIKSWRERRERTLPELNDRSRPRLAVAPVVSLAVTAVILQWAINYYLNTVHKDGPTWKMGTAIYYFAHQTRLMHPFGVWLADQLPLKATALLTHTTLLVEGALAFLWVSPFFSKAARMVAWVLGVGLHLGILAFATLGPFVWVMMIPYAMFIPRELWEWLTRRLRAQRRRLEVAIGDNAVAIAWARVVKRLDGLSLVRFVPAPAGAKRVVLTEVSAQGDLGSKLRGGKAVRRLLGALPLPNVANRLLQLLLGGPLATLERQLHRRPEVWARRLGLDGPRVLDAAPASPARLRLRRGVRAVGELMVAFLIVLCTSQVLVENRAIPAWLKPSSRPDWVTAIIVYGRFFQGWAMFAPDPPNDDGWVVVDGRTVDGRKLDPLTGKPPNFSMDLPLGPDFSAQWEAFHMRIHQRRFEMYYPGFEQYLKNQHLISGRANDRLVAFDAWYVMRKINPPGLGFTDPTYQKLISFGNVKDSGVPQPPKAASTMPAPAAPAKQHPARPRPSAEPASGHASDTRPAASAARAVVGAIKGAGLKPTTSSATAVPPLRGRDSQAPPEPRAKERSVGVGTTDAVQVH